MLHPIIGLEIHIRLNTKSKMFCSCKNMADDDPPNTAICPICTAHPGTLPVLNAMALEKGLLMALALNCEIPPFSKFDRKNYFYPDLPKGYQISQYDQPISKNGWVEFDAPSTKGMYRKKVRITRLHLEDDAGKLIHEVNHSERSEGSRSSSTYVDFNRAGSPLMEIVTEPDFRTPAEAKSFLQELQRIARYLNVSEADMEKGHLRCDANISLRENREQRIENSGDDYITDYSTLSPKTEVKNINSFKAVERALEYEQQRQTKLWEAGTPVNHLSTRGWDDGRSITVEQRTKEEAHDYRYFPEPDLPPITTAPEYIERLRARLPELPDAKRRRFMKEFGFERSDAALFCETRELSGFVEKVMAEITSWLKDTPEDEGAQPLDQRRRKIARLGAGWIGSKLLGVLNQEHLTLASMKADPENIAELITMIARGRLNSTNALQLLTHMVIAGGDPSQLLEERGLTQISDESALQPIIQTVLEENSKVVADVKSGKMTALQFLVGQIMKKTKGTANPEVATQLLRDELGIE